MTVMMMVVMMVMVMMVMVVMRPFRDAGRTAGHPHPRPGSGSYCGSAPGSRSRPCPAPAPPAAPTALRLLLRSGGRSARPPPGSAGPCRTIPDRAGPFRTVPGEPLPRPWHCPSPPPDPGHTRRCGSRAGPDHCPAAAGAARQPQVPAAECAGRAAAARVPSCQTSKAEHSLPAGRRFSAPLSGCDPFLNRVTHYRTQTDVLKTETAG